MVLRLRQHNNIYYIGYTADGCVSAAVSAWFLNTRPATNYNNGTDAAMMDTNSN